MILELVPQSDSILFEKLERFNFENPPADPNQIAVDLAETMLAKNGIGLAANQVGLRHRAFVIRADPILCCFNPTIVDQSEETWIDEEGCLTYPGMIIKIKRPKIIKIRFTRPNGETVTEKWSGITARIACHETDHLDGIVFMKRASPVHLALAKNKSKVKF